MSDKIYPTTIKEEVEEAFARGEKELSTEVAERWITALMAKGMTREAAAERYQKEADSAWKAAQIKKSMT